MESRGVSMVSSPKSATFGLPIMRKFIEYKAIILRIEASKFRIWRRTFIHAVITPAKQPAKIAPNVASHGLIPFTISVANMGAEAVNIWADIVIKGPTNKPLATWSTDNKIIGYQGAGKLVTNWVGDKEPGEYVAEVTLHHGDKTMLLKKTFAIGDKSVIVSELFSDRFVLGEIVPLSLKVQNKWNSEFRNVFAEMFDQDANAIRQRIFKK